MSVDQRSQDVAPTNQGINPNTRVLTAENQIIWEHARERQAYAMLQDRTFVHTIHIDRDILNATGIITEFQTAFNILGWNNAWVVNEQGSRELTMEFLCTLEVTRTHCTFRLFNEDQSFTWKQFSALLGFDKDCAVNLAKACNGFDKKTFWQQISGRRDISYPRVGQIHNPHCAFCTSLLPLLFTLGMIPA